MSGTPEDNAAAMRARLADLGTKFIERTRAELATLRACQERLAAGDVTVLDEMTHLAHRAAGTGATLGFSELGQRARAVELIAAAQSREAPPEAAAVARLAQAIEALEAELGPLAPRVE